VDDGAGDDGPSFAMLLARHSNAAEDSWLRVVLPRAAPLLCYCASCGRVLRDQAGRTKQDESDEGRADQVFTHLGIASFAALLPLGLLFINPLHFAYAAAIRAARQYLRNPGDSDRSRVAAMAWREQVRRTLTVATSVSLIGSLISLAALIFAWPYSAAVVITALINCAVSLAIALASSGMRCGTISGWLTWARLRTSLWRSDRGESLQGNVFWWGENGLQLAASLV